MQIRYVQQSAATSFTIQIPYELNPESSARPILRIKENGATAAEVAINAVTDNVHVINSCDQTGIFLSLAADLPAGTCAPMAMHARGPLVSRTAPAKPGETLVLWAYGLGAIDHPIPEFCCAFPEQLPLAVQPFFTSFSFADPGRFPLRRLPPAIPSYAGMTGSGLYQVHFVVPDVPASLSPCTGGMGNVSVQVNGPNSSDTAQICVQP